MDSSSCRAVSLAWRRSSRPIYCEQMMEPPVAMAENRLIITMLSESTSDTAAMACEPTLLTIMVSAMPISEARICSSIRGIRSAHSCFLINTGAFVPFQRISVGDAPKYSMKRRDLKHFAHVISYLRPCNLR